MRAILLLILLTTALPARAEGERPGAFDYYVLALSWSPSWCAAEGNGASDQCERDFGWILHGLWPQYEDGWPSYCPTPERPPSRRQTADMADITGSAGLAWHQWRKHGVCSGLSPESYFDAARSAFDSIVRPEAFRRLTDDVILPADLVEEAFLAENPHLDADSIVVECRSRAIREVRICLTLDLEPRACGADLEPGCTLDRALFPAIR